MSERRRCAKASVAMKELRMLRVTIKNASLYRLQQCHHNNRPVRIWGPAELKIRRRAAAVEWRSSLAWHCRLRHAGGLRWGPKTSSHRVGYNDGRTTEYRFDVVGVEQLEKEGPDSELEEAPLIGPARDVTWTSFWACADGNSKPSEATTTPDHLARLRDDTPDCTQYMYNGC